MFEAVMPSLLKQPLFLGLAGLVLGALIVVLIGHWGQRQRERELAARRTRLPQQWPLVARPIASESEMALWRWLSATFPQHHIAPKLPLTRMSVQRQAGVAGDWMELLTRAYCTFAVVDQHGRVVGCIDRASRQLTAFQRQLRASLLRQCGIRYVIVNSEGLPDAQTLRTDVLGPAVAALPPAPLSESARIEATRNRLHNALDRNRSTRLLDAPTVFADTEPSTTASPLEEFGDLLDPLVEAAPRVPPARDAVKLVSG